MYDPVFWRGYIAGVLTLTLAMPFCAYTVPWLRRVIRFIKRERRKTYGR